MTVTVLLKPKTPVDIALRMVDSGLFQKSDCAMISEWITCVNQLEDPYEIVDTLIYLIVSVLHPAITVSEEAENLDRMLEFEDELKQQIASLHNDDVEVDSLIDRWDREQALVEEMAMIENIFQMKMSVLQSSFDKLNSKIESTFERLKQRVVQIIQTKQRKHQDLCEKVKPLFTAMQQLIVQIDSLISSARNFDEQLVIQQQVMKETIVKEKGRI